MFLRVGRYICYNAVVIRTLICRIFVRRLVALLFAAIAFSVTYAADVTSLKDLSHLNKCGGFTNVSYDVSGSIVSYFRRPLTHEWIVGVSDGTNSVFFYELNDAGIKAESIADPRLNDRVRIKGHSYLYDGKMYFGYRKMEFVGHSPIGAEADITPAEMFAADTPPRVARLNGVVRDAFRDESDPNFVVMMLNCNGVPAMLMVVDCDREIAEPTEFLGHMVSAGGVVADPRIGVRRYAGRVMMVSGRENLHVLSDASEPSAAIPDISAIGPMPPGGLALLGRHAAVGTVRAVWHGNCAILETDAGEIVEVHFVHPEAPQCGTRVRVTGFPETDIYTLKLGNAVWERATGRPLARQVPKDVSPSELFKNHLGKSQINIRANGCAFRIKGRVQYLPSPEAMDGWVGIYSDGFIVAVDAGAMKEAVDGLEIGSEVSVAGVCVVDTDSSASGVTLPRAKGIFIVPRDAEDVAVLSRPPWWTPRRLGILVCALAVVIAAILLWNIALSRLAERRGRTLAEERIERAASELKVEERTRLAVELHDALSQTLAGISMEVGAVKETVNGEDSSLSKRLDFIANAINACRNELKNCIWDLRSEALDEDRMDDAIRKSLAKDIRGEELSIRFNVPRERLTDNTVHAIVRTVRELAVNAIRHGKAKHVAIAGAIEGDTLRFSVRDDGCGFDPAKAPTVTDGHFGLAGIRERIAPFGGSFEISSAPGKGTKAVISYKVPHVDGEEVLA